MKEYRLLHFILLASQGNRRHMTRELFLLQLVQICCTHSRRICSSRTNDETSRKAHACTPFKRTLREPLWMTSVRSLNGNAASIIRVVLNNRAYHKCGHQTRDMDMMVVCRHNVLLTIRLRFLLEHGIEIRERRDGERWMTLDHCGYRYAPRNHYQACIRISSPGHRRVLCVTRSQILNKTYSDSTISRLSIQQRRSRELKRDPRAFGPPWILVALHSRPLC
ncbi:uncharacterized protein K489DRAFT_242675 [Dissoconium aciculare CBS 342.82]|uniref:Uncharacterized protein n=1 Tax=Dissoconium aciculare CBS 342.82 TaxID=1314786 RepID=A0A6J3M353_9PEZI|nr:uncharacterized protein K489DRAFT_242675 [Dissoconium aciculare CBS 342.82]KAF1822420.1 hypothetical protein K489DRAFT_242675 [Dissoconium aciculare CBS 342.82]